MGTQIWIASNPTDPFLRSFTVEKQVGLVAPRPPIPGQPSPLLVYNCNKGFTCDFKSRRHLLVTQWRRCCSAQVSRSFLAADKKKFAGAVLIAVHHPPYVAVIP